MSEAALALEVLRRQLVRLAWVSDLWVAGSLATGDHVAGVSDLDLVAVVDGPVDPARQSALTVVHRDLDAESGRGVDLGCVYVSSTQLSDPAALHPTWDARRDGPRPVHDGDRPAADQDPGRRLGRRAWLVGRAAQGPAPRWRPSSRSRSGLVTSRGVTPCGPRHTRGGETAASPRPVVGGHVVLSAGTSGSRCTHGCSRAGAITPQRLHPRVRPAMAPTA